MKLSVPSACHEDWQQMQPVQGGRHCSHCQKNVIDFTSMSDSEILLLLQKNKDLCGRFNSFQLNRELNPPPKKRWPWALLVGLTALGTETAMAKSSPEVTCAPASERITPQTADSGRVISGYVLCNNQKFQGVTVLIKGTRTGVLTNDSGYFKLEVPATIESKLIEIAVSLVGFKMETLTVDPSDHHLIDVNLVVNDAIACEDIVAGQLRPYHDVIKKPTFWQRIKSAFKQ